MRAASGGERLYLIALTGYGGPEAHARALEAGFELYLVKPINVAELPRVLEAAGRQRSPRALKHGPRASPAMAPPSRVFRLVFFSKPTKRRKPTCRINARVASS